MRGLILGQVIFTDFLHIHLGLKKSAPYKILWCDWRMVFSGHHGRLEHIFYGLLNYLTQVDTTEQTWVKWGSARLMSM